MQPLWFHVQEQSLVQTTLGLGNHAMCWWLPRGYTGDISQASEGWHVCYCGPGPISLACHWLAS